jgi:hypothetical protein
MIEPPRFFVNDVVAATWVRSLEAARETTAEPVSDA